jgi:hypothetical protein
VDFERIYRFLSTGTFFVTRDKAGLRINRLKSRLVGRSASVRSDQAVWLIPAKSTEHYPDLFAA